MQPRLAKQHACKSTCMMDQGYHILMIVWSACQPRSRTEAGGRWRRVWLPQIAFESSVRMVPQSLGPLHGSLFSFLFFLPPARSARQKPSTAPSVTPESRRGHPNSLAEPLPVAPWALLALLAHARRGLQLLAKTKCGPLVGLLMSLGLRLRWHWTRKCGPDEGPQRSSPSMPSI